MDNLANFIALAFVLHFLWSYYFNCIRKGFSIDIWHFSLIFDVFVIHIMLPFTRSNLNIFALGPVLMMHAQAYVNEAYFISALGYLGILIGGSLWQVRVGMGLRQAFSSMIEIPARGVLFLLDSRPLLLFHGIFAISLISVVLAYYFSVAGFGMDLGKTLVKSPELRPIAQFTTFYSVLIGSYALARFEQYRERSMLYITLGISLGLLFFGSRTAILSIVLLPMLVLFIKMGRRIRISLLIIGGGFAVCFSILLNALRGASFSLNSLLSEMFLNIFFGNSFSDTRDFAVVLSFWDGHYFLGKTYLAGVMAFVPRFLSSFRNQWSLGVVTATMAGLSPTEHAGLRIGLFGESFLNFGLPAVLLLGIFVGACTRLIDLRMKQSAAMLPTSGMRIYSYYLITAVISAAVNTANMSAVYTIALILWGSWVALKLGRAIKPLIF